MEYSDFRLSTDYGTCTVNCPGTTTLITPPSAHWEVELTVNAGTPPTRTVGEPGFQGVVMGIHGTGVGTPSAAVVAATKAGLPGEMHIPKVGMFTIGIESIMVAAIGPPDMMGGPFGITTSELMPGGTANMHLIVAPIETSGAIIYPPYRHFYAYSYSIST